MIWFQTHLERSENNNNNKNNRKSDNIVWTIYTELVSMAISSHFMHCQWPPAHDWQKNYTKHKVIKISIKLSIDLRLKYKKQKHQKYSHWAIPRYTRKKIEWKQAKQIHVALLSSFDSGLKKTIFFVLSCSLLMMSRQPINLLIFLFYNIFLLVLLSCRWRSC